MAVAVVAMAGAMAVVAVVAAVSDPKRQFL